MSKEVKAQMEGMFSKEDPWRFKTAPMEIERYNRLLDILPKEKYRWMLDVGCAEGVFTTKLFERFEPLGIIGIDISSNAIKRAMDYYKKYNHKLYFYEFDIEEGSVVGNFDVIYLNEILYLLKPESVEKVIKNLAENLSLGGYLIIENNWIRDWHKLFGINYNKIIEKFLVKEKEIKYSHKWEDPLNHPKDYPVHYYSVMRFRKE